MASQFWERLKSSRKYAGLTQAQVAAVVGLSRSGYAFWEDSNPQTRTNPTAQQLSVFANLTKVPLDWLLDDDADVNDVWRLQSGAAPLSSDAVTPNPPAQQLNVKDRLAESYWRAVEFNVVTQNPAMQTSFRVEVSLRLGLFANFCSGRYLVSFAASLGRDNLVERVGRLLLLESAIRRRMSKSILIWAREGVQDLNGAAEVVERFGVAIVQAPDVVAAVDYLLSLT